MKLNKFLWDIYKQSEQGKNSIRLFTEGPILDIVTYFGQDFKLQSDDIVNWITDFIDFTVVPELPDTLDEASAHHIIDQIIENGIILKFDDGDEKFGADKPDVLLGLIPIISMWLYSQYPDFFKPYFYRNKFQTLTKIADTFGFELPEVPLKRYKTERIRYYWKICEVFNQFQLNNELSVGEFCAFLYDFAPNYIKDNNTSITELPKPTQVWLVGGDKGGGDFDFLDNPDASKTSQWQGNEDTKRGDIIIMYCLAPRSCIHSVWRATADGIADPFFHYYSNIFIGNGQKTAPIDLNELKADPYFSKHPLVRKNLQGVSGYPFSSIDYEAILSILKNKGEDIDKLPRLFTQNFTTNETLLNERDVELALIEPLIDRLGYSTFDWVRQLSLRMGRGERNFPDYAFLNSKEKGFETADMLIEAKFWIKTNRELDETFKQTWSYGLRLEATKLVIADKEAIWIYQKQNGTFDRTQYLKKYWKELENPDEFQKVTKLIGKR